MKLPRWAGTAVATALNRLAESIEKVSQATQLQGGRGITITRFEGGQTVSLAAIAEEGETGETVIESWDHFSTPNLVDPENVVNIQIVPGVLGNLIATNFDDYWGTDNFYEVFNTGIYYSKLVIETLDGVVSSFEHLIDGTPPQPPITGTLPATTFEFPIGVIIDGVPQKLVTGFPIVVRPIEAYRLPKAEGTFGFGGMPYGIF